MTTTKTKPEPPANAVARDPHWTATRERLRNRQRPILTMTICDDTDVKARYDSAVYTERRARAAAELEPDDIDLAKALKAAESELAAAREAFDAVAIVLRFQALPRADFEALKKEHPASEEQTEDGLAFNIDTFGPALVAASSLDGISEEEATEYLETWAAGEADQLFSTAWNVQGETRADLGKG